jgi:CRP/FNR family nitrogen fixation transcriptional regulator
MLVRTNTVSRPIEGHLAALVGDSVFCSEFNYRGGREIFGEGEEAQFVYQIDYGAVRTHKLLPDGRRQINSFHLPGDMFGFENGATHRFTAEAIVQTKVRIVRRCGLLDATTHRRSGTMNLIGLITRNLEYAENRMLLLGRKTALERVVAFLLEMDERLAHPDVIVLPMNRRDIADYLGLTLETVSRAFSMLRDERILQFVEGNTQRKLTLLDRARLASFDIGPIQRKPECYRVSGPVASQWRPKAAPTSV